MFPRGFLFFIFIMVIDLILKSAKDKKKIEKSRRKRMIELGNPSKEAKEFIPPFQGGNRPIIRREINRVPVERVKFEKKEETFQVEPWEEPLFSDGYNEKPTSINMDKVVKEKTTKSNKKIKEDILRGIIFSEILSEPKAFRNKKSM